MLLETIELQLCNDFMGTNMSSEIKTKLTKHYAFDVTPTIVKQFLQIVRQFELSPVRFEALNSASLAVVKPRFFQSDKDKLFYLFETSQDEFISHLKEISTIDLSRGVSGNPFNIFTIWCAHRAHKSKLNAQERNDFIMSLYQYMAYSFFTSTVEKLFKHGAKEELMAYTVETLSDKSDIKVSGSWRNEIASLVESTRERGSIWYKTEESFAPDIQALNMIVYLQNNLRKKMIRLANAYYENVERGKSIRSSTLISDIGDKLEMKEVEAHIPDMIMRVSNTAIDPTAFIDIRLVETVVKMSKGVVGSKFITLLKTFCTIAESQKKKGHGSKIDGKGPKKRLVGYQALITEMIQTTYREATLDEKCNMSRVSLVLKTRSIYSASRVSNESILCVKNTVDDFVITSMRTKREATVTAYRTAFLLYLILMTFEI